VRAFFCFCQPLYFVPAYSIVSLNLGTRRYDTHGRTNENHGERGGHGENLSKRQCR
jgi:hypothetical protein